MLPGAGNALGALELTSDGRTLVTGDSRGNVLFLDAATGRPTGRRYTALSGITALRFSPDGRFLAVAGEGFVDLLDARTHEYLRRLFAGPQTASLLGTLVFSPDSRVLAADVIRTEPRLAAVVVRWNTRTGNRLGPPHQVDREPEAALVGYMAGGARLVTSSSAEDATVIRDATTLRPVRRLRGGAARTALSPDGRVAALGGADGSVRLLELRTGVLRVATDRHDAAVTDLRFTPDSRTLLTAGGDGRLVAWNVAELGASTRSPAMRVRCPASRSRRTAGPRTAPGRMPRSSPGTWLVIAGSTGSSPRPHAALRSSPRSCAVRRPTEFGPEGVAVPLAGLAVATTRDGGTFVVPDGAGYVDVFDGRTLTRTASSPNRSRAAGRCGCARSERSYGGGNHHGRSPALRRPAQPATARAAPAPVRPRRRGRSRSAATAGGSPPAAAPSPRCACGTSAVARS